MVVCVRGWGTYTSWSPFLGDPCPCAKVLDICAFAPHIIDPNQVVIVSESSATLFDVGFLQERCPAPFDVS